MKPTIYIASDSTVQSYAPELYPQTGWGQMLIHYFAGTADAALGMEPGSYPEGIRAYHPENTRFPHVMRYETDAIAIDNRAFAGRSARTFWEEGRFSDMASCFCPGDYFFFQFAHNDANAKKPERYIPVKDYPLWLDRYVKAALSFGCTPVLITAIAMRIFRPDGTLPVSFPEYRQAMLDYADANHIPCIDLGKLTRDYCQALGEETSKRLFMYLAKGEYPGGPYGEGKEDYAHLRLEGALAFAGLLADGIRQCPALSELASLLRP